MTELIIAGTRAVLPNDFSFSLIEENPYFTKNGKYTYDIELSLLNPVNAKLYRHYNRMNARSISTTPRTAQLITDNILILNGSEIIIKVTERSATIQLISGNSELNFLIGGDKLLRSLNLGSVYISQYAAYGPDVLFSGFIADELAQTYPAKNYVLAPFRALDNSFTGNDWKYMSLIDHPVKPSYISNSYRPQPYLCHIISRVISSLGYTLNYNAIANHYIFKYYYLVHGYSTLEYAKMLPNWTVNEFISKLELQFDCTCLVDEKTKSVSIYFNSSSAISNDKQDIVINDSFETEIDNENTSTVSNSNLSYDFDENDFYRFNKLKSEIVKYALNDTYSSLDELLTKINNTSDSNRFRKIYSGSHGDMIAYPIDDAGTTIAKKVNHFKNLIQNTSVDNKLNFDIMPAPFFSLIETLTYNAETYHFYWQMPLVEVSEPQISDLDVAYILSKLIEGEQQIKEEPEVTKMYLAIYKGLKPMKFYPTEVPSWSTAGMPTSFVESLAEYFTGTELSTTFFLGTGENPFRLSWLKDNLYSSALHPDTTKLTTANFFDKKLNITKKFIANNNEFVCRKIERRITVNGLDKIAKGYFHKII